MPKKLIIGMIIGVLIIGLVVASYFLFQYLTRPDQATIAPTPPPITVPEERPPIPADAFQTLPTGAVAGLSKNLAGDGIRYIDTHNNQLQEADFERQAPRNLLAFELPFRMQNAFAAHWSPTSNQVIIEYTLDEQDLLSKEIFELAIRNRPLRFFDPLTGEFTDLNPLIRSLAWSPDGRLIAYHLRDEITGENAIYIANPDTTNPQRVIQLQLLAVDIFWLDQNRLLIAEKPTPGIQPLVILQNLRNNTSQLILRNHQPRFGVSLLPSPDGNKILASFTSDIAGASLATEIISSEGEVLSTLPFQTFAEKCAWGADSVTLYCAIPDTGAIIADGFPFSYWAGIIPVNDTFASFNATTNETRQIIPSPLNIDAIGLIVSQEENIFAFINRLDGRLTILRP